MEADVIIRIRLVDPIDGGRNSPIVGPDYRCPMFIRGNGFDCRLFDLGAGIQFGKDYDVGAMFLSPGDALLGAYAGEDITLWEGKTIATGKIVRVLSRVGPNTKSEI
jgi:hypothetical protein